ncbi:hypothetical protein AKJ36_02395 [candidate division MSBL1 archaeon SCGC-AAA259I07]|uniref:Uncharacterized protein n=1 Tax=candidate division MSBL1 archaeon SCGC-AAA259I07 TaxID=1698266 RepID=A0A133UKN8_9EURY|nr:hypothetical protein AKJ36_02395 [candidate division MSBL1 archaeon SCGC-AAA259I07]
MSEVQIDRRLWTAMKKIVERTENPVYEFAQADRIVLWATPKNKPKSWPDRIEAMRGSVPSCTPAGWWTPQERDSRLITVKRMGNSISPGLVGIDKACQVINGEVHLVESFTAKDISGAGKNKELVKRGWIVNREDPTVELGPINSEFRGLKKKRDTGGFGIRCKLKNWGLEIAPSEFQSEEGGGSTI